MVMRIIDSLKPSVGGQCRELVAETPRIARVLTQQDDALDLVRMTPAYQA